MEQKNPYRDNKTSRHPNFRYERHSVWQSLPVRLSLAVGLLFLIVLGYERLEGKGNFQASHLASTKQTEATALPEKVGQAMPKPEKPVKLPDPTVATINPIRPRQLPENPQHSPVEKSVVTFQYVMDRDGFGNIVGSGSINGKGVRFLADTGATVVVIPEKIAQQIGLKKGAPLSFKTGGGVIVHYTTTLDTLTLGQIEIRNVAAAINPAMQDDFVLLGMSALGLMDMQMDKGNLVLKYKASISEAAEQPPVNDEPFKRSHKECARQGNKFDKETLECLRGN